MNKVNAMKGKKHSHILSGRRSISNYRIEKVAVFLGKIFLGHRIDEDGLSVSLIIIR